jgi:hypothetical protein
MKTLKIAIGVLILAALAVSCIPEQQSIGDAGTTFIKFLPGGYKLVAVNAQSTTQQALLFEVRKDVNSEANLKTPTTVVLDFDVSGAILTQYNTAHSTTYEALPSNLASTLPATTGGKITLDFASGVASLDVKAVIPNSNAFDFAKKYALAYKIGTVTGPGVISQGTLDTVIVQIMAKNAYHGTYKCEGYRIRPGNPTEPVSQSEALGTTGAKTVRKQGFGNYMTFYINIEVTTNTIVVGGTTCYKVIATPTDAAGVVTGEMYTTWTGDPLTPPAPPANPNEINYYNPVTKVFVLNCLYYSGAGNRQMYEVLTYTGS